MAGWSLKLSLVWAELSLMMYLLVLFCSLLLFFYEMIHSPGDTKSREKLVPTMSSEDTVLLQTLLTI